MAAGRLDFHSRSSPNNTQQQNISQNIFPHTRLLGLLRFLTHPSWIQKPETAAANNIEATHKNSITSGILTISILTGLIQFINFNAER
jgi:hypothetical protein